MCIRDSLKAVLVDDVANADHVDVFGGNLNLKITLVHTQLQVRPLLTTNGARHDLFDRGCAVVRVDDRLTDFKRHGWTPGCLRG